MYYECSDCFAVLTYVNQQHRCPATYDEYTCRECGGYHHFTKGETICDDGYAKCAYCESFIKNTIVRVATHVADARGGVK